MVLLIHEMSLSARAFIHSYQFNHTMYIHTSRLNLIVSVHTEFFLERVSVIHDTRPEPKRERLRREIVRVFGEDRECHRDLTSAEGGFLSCHCITDSVATSLTHESERRVRREGTDCCLQVSDGAHGMNGRLLTHGWHWRQTWPTRDIQPDLQTAIQNLYNSVNSVIQCSSGRSITSNPRMLVSSSLV